MTENTLPIAPSIYSTLIKVKEGELSYGHYLVRHPGGIFSIIFSDVLKPFNALCLKVIELQKNAKDYSTADEEELLSLTQKLLFNIVKYFEGGYEIFQCFVPKEELPTGHLHKWFETKPYGKCVKEYFKNVDPFIGAYRKVLNELKHSSNALKLFQFIDEEKGVSSIGFYLQGVSANGALGPDVDLHPLYHGTLTAWSYNFHLRKIFYSIFLIANELSKVVDELIIQNNLRLTNAELLRDKDVLKHASITAYNSIRSLDVADFFFFPQEEDHEMPNPRISENEKNFIFLWKTPGEKVPRKGVKVSFQMTGDGFSNKFAMPYFFGR